MIEIWEAIKDFFTKLFESIVGIYSTNKYLEVPALADPDPSKLWIRSRDELYLAHWLTESVIRNYRPWNDINLHYQPEEKEDTIFCEYCGGTNKGDVLECCHCGGNPFLKIKE